MFVQVIEGTVRDPDRFRSQAARWPEELKPGAPGYLGATWGVDDDGRAVLVARFDSEESARANSGRPEQGEWWSAMEPAFESVTFHDCPEVDTIIGGGSDEADFVQVVDGRVKDRDAARRQLRGSEEQLHRARPDILGALFAWHDDGDGFTQLVFFRSEDDARSGESAMEEQDVDDGYREMMASEPTFIDLRDPRFD